MTVVFVPRFGRDTGSRSCPNWTLEERAELFRLFDALRRLGLADGVEFGKTDLNDPQFYVLGRGEDYPCILFVSRIGSRDHPWYVAQDEAGEVVADNAVLRAVIDAVVKARSTRRSVPYLTRVVGLLVCCRLAAEQALADICVDVSDAPFLDSVLELAT